MSAQNGEVEDLSQREAIGVGVRALVGSSWGFFAVGDLDDAAARRAGEQATAIARASAAVPGPDAVDLLEIAGAAGQLGQRLRGGPAVGLAGGEGRPGRRRDGDHAGRGRAAGQGAVPIWDTRKWFVSSEGHRIDQRIRECGAGMHCHGRRRGRRRQRRSYPGVPRAVRHPRLGAGPRARPARQRRRGSPPRRRRLLTAPRVPGRRRPTSSSAASRWRCRSTSRSGHAVELDRILGWEAAFAGTSWLDLAQLGSLRFGSRPDDDHRRRRRCPAALGSFGYDDEGTPAAPVDIVRDGIWVGVLSGRDSAALRRPGLAGAGAGRRLGPAADGAHDQRRAAAGRLLARGDDRRDRRRHLDGHQPLLVDRRPAAELPVRLRDRLGDQERPARAGCCATRRTPGSARGSGGRWTCWRQTGRVDLWGTPELRQGPAGPGRPHRPSRGAGPLPRRPGRGDADERRAKTLAARVLELRHGGECRGREATVTCPARPRR